MIGALKPFAASAFRHAMEDNLENIRSQLERGSADFLDVGCDDGRLTLELAAVSRAQHVAGVEVVEERAAIARDRGIEVSATDLNDRLPYDDDSFDVAVSNQVIEHLADTDRFVEELARVVRPGGYVITSTENLAGWHNIASLVLGWQPFSLTNVTAARRQIGNPLALHAGERWHDPETWQHRRVFAYRGLRELFEAHDFAVESILGAGYYPFPRRLARIDARHAAFLSLKARVLS